MRLRISARQSPLAQIQAVLVGQALLERHPSLQLSYLFRESLGDKNLTDPLWKMPEKGVFTEDFLQDIIQHRTDLVVHSWKDLPTEGNPKTQIAATLPRADQRDLLIFKKTSRQKKQVRIFSSSPRRSYNLTEFFAWALPWRPDGVKFENVRGNVQTRVKKLLDSGEVDGLIVAKAAFDRLLGSSQFQEVAFFLRTVLRQCDWMILPLSANPNAAAQGALAIEVANDRQDILELVQSIHCPETFLSVQSERQILKKFGGGCHLALGMSVLNRPYGRIEIVRGLAPDGVAIREKKFYPSKKLPLGVSAHRMDIQVTRSEKDYELTDIELIKVAKAEFIQVDKMKNKYLWTAGLKTWAKLADHGLWVHGSQEGLGENEDPRLESLLGQDANGDVKTLNWARLTHDQAELDQPHSVAAYHITYKMKPHADLNQKAYFWKSAGEFSFALQQFPNLKNAMHVCGPGRTYEVIKSKLGSEQNLYVELSDEFISVV